MSANEIRYSIANILDNTPDEEVLKAYHQILLNLLMVQNRSVVAYDVDEKPLTYEQLKKEVEAAGARVQSGLFVRHEDAKRQAENW